MSNDVALDGTDTSAVPGLIFSPIAVAAVDATATEAAIPAIPARTLAGTPTATGDYTLIYIVTDGRTDGTTASGSVTASFTVTVVDTAVLRQMSQADRSYFTGEDVTLILPAGDSLPTDDSTSTLTYSLTDADGNNAATDNVIPGLVFFPGQPCAAGPADHAQPGRPS